VDTTLSPHPVTLLLAGVPLTLLLDLSCPPSSRRLLEEEPSDTSWIVPVRA
jgi:hypothetical protein